VHGASINCCILRSILIGRELASALSMTSWWGDVVIAINCRLSRFQLRIVSDSNTNLSMPLAKYWLAAFFLLDCICATIKRCLSI
jgi:hypothetical protein